VLSISSELAEYAGKPVQAAAGSAPVKFTISAASSWTTSNGIAFALTPAADRVVGIPDGSTAFEVATAIDKSETQDIVSGPAAGKVYVKYRHGFSISVTGQGSGAAAGGLSI